MAESDDRGPAEGIGDGPRIPSSGSPVDDVVAAYLDRLNSGERLDRARIEAEHPEVAREVIERLEVFLDLAEEPGTARDLGTLGEYRLLRQLGRGGMGIVYEAWQGSMARSVALKVLPAGIASDARAFSRFVREAQAAGRLRHPNVVPVHGMGLDDRTPYYAMEYVAGETLARVLSRLRDAARDPSEGRRRAALEEVTGMLGGRRPSAADVEPREEESLEPAAGGGGFGEGEVNLVYCARLAEAFAGAADGLHHAHSRGVIHRDIKPSNLILERGTDGEGDPGGRLRILDFGLARLDGVEGLTASGDLLGTLLYMSPEQARARRAPVDHRTDIYSLGATLYELLTLRPPFRGRDEADTLSQIVSRDAVPPRRLNPRIPRDLETIVLKCLRKDPGDRYGTAEALAQDLRRFVRGDPIEARPQSALERILRRAWRRRHLAATGLLAAALLAMAGILILSRVREEQRLAAEEYRTTVLDAAIAIEEAGLTGDLRGVRPSLLRPGWVLEPLLDPLPEPSKRAEAGGASRSSGADRIIASLERAAPLCPRRPDAYYHLARALRAVERVDGALEAVRAAVREGPDFVPARSLEARILREAGRGEEADSALLRAEGSPEWSLWMRVQRDWEAARWKEAAAGLREILQPPGRLGRPAERAEPYLGAEVELRGLYTIALFNAGDLRRAAESCVETRWLWPGAPGPGLFLGLTYCRMGRIDDAEDVFAEVLDGAEESAKERVILAVADTYRTAREWKRAVAWAERLPREPARSVVASLACYDSGDVPAALEWAERAVDAGPREPMAWLVRATANASLDRVAPAREDAEEAIALGLGKRFRRTPDTYLLALLCAGRHEEVVTEAEKALAAGPNDLYLHFRLGQALRGLGRAKEAEGLYTRAVERFPDRPDVRGIRGWTRRDLGDWPCAAEDLRWRFDHEPRDAGAGAALAWALSMAGEVEEALEVCESVRAQVSRIPWVHYYLGQVLWRSGRNEEAVREYGAGGAIDSTLAWPSAGIAEVRAEQGRLPEAEAGFREALDLLSKGGDGPSAGWVRSFLAVVLWRQGRPAEAIGELRRAAE